MKVHYIFLLVVVSFHRTIGVNLFSKCRNVFIRKLMYSFGDRQSTASERLKSEELTQTIEVLRQQIRQLKTYINASKIDNLILARDRDAMIRSYETRIETLTNQHFADMKNTVEMLTSDFDQQKIQLLQEAKQQFEEEKNTLITILKSEHMLEVSEIKQMLSVSQSELKESQSNTSQLETSIHELQNTYNTMLTNFNDRDKQHIQTIKELRASLKTTTPLKTVSTDINTALKYPVETLIDSLSQQSNRPVKSQSKMHSSKITNRTDRKAPKRETTEYDYDDSSKYTTNRVIVSSGTSSRSR